MWHSYYSVVKKKNLGSFKSVGCTCCFGRCHFLCLRHKINISTDLLKPILTNEVKIGFPIFSVEYTLPSKWRMDEVGGVKMLVIAVIDCEASFQVFRQVYNAWKIGLD